ncbi:MAG: Gfo/Idh/MocA family protein [Candidatus Promineifilaceae bacterium]|jgi:predicted dehydrogenase
MSEKVSVGFVGGGNISGQYIRGCRKFEILNITAVSDLNMDRARAVAQENDIPRACTVEELLADPDVDIVLNLTIPAAHAAVSLSAIEAGKHVYSEKPLALTTADGRAVLNAVAANGVRLGCAPDTFLGGGLQTCRKLIDDGVIGEPIAATAFMMSGGPESWHPNPFFLYEVGAGPLFDVGPYYLTTLVNLLGPVAGVSALARKTFPERVATSKELYGQRIPVYTPTHVAGLLDFAAGPVGTLITSFDIPGGSQLPRIEIYGSKGTLIVPDPNTFKGPVRLKLAGEKEWQEVPLTHSPDVGRGIGLADMAYAVKSGRPHRVSGDLAYHVLENMESLLRASEERRYLPIESTCARPQPLPVGLPQGTLDS